ncbi:MAG: hypothetical protein LBP24_00565 [Coriobacteriales bacterium]|jgi:hypothetical protein|nr:hypothetical protein [Coriobacteriales bacterium]
MPESIHVNPLAATACATQVEEAGDSAVLVGVVAGLNVALGFSQGTFRSELEGFNTILTELSKDITGLCSDTAFFLRNAQDLFAQADQRSVDLLTLLRGGTNG